MNTSIDIAADAALRRHSPLTAAIRTAVADHPAVADASDETRPARRIAVTAAANAIADPDTDKPSDAPQLVDDAVISLSLTEDREAPVHLNVITEDHHRQIAAYLALNPTAVSCGLDQADSVARAETAIRRVALFRSAEHVQLIPAMTVVIKALLARKTPIEDLSDESLLELVRDSFDVIITEVPRNDG